MRKILFLVFISLLLTAQTYAAQSTIKIAHGSACMGDDKSRKQTEALALTDARRNAAEAVKAYVSSMTEVKDFELQKDLIAAYANATVTIIEEMEKGWYKDSAMGDCFKIRIKTEVTPDEKAMKMAGEKARDATLDDPALPLSVKIWTDKQTYRGGEKIKIYLKGNKPFFARVIYRDASKNHLQLLPNPYRRDNYFHGGVVYEIPSARDNFELEVNPPFGEENIIVYAGVSELGDLNLEAEGGVYAVKTRSNDIGIKTRSIKIKSASNDASDKPTEFSEGAVTVRTQK